MHWMYVIGVYHKTSEINCIEKNGVRSRNIITGVEITLNLRHYLSNN